MSLTLAPEHSVAGDDAPKQHLQGGSPELTKTSTGGEPEPSPRFTLDGSLALENELRETCHLIGREVQRCVSARHLQGLLLGGGYGRGEGGVLRTPTGERPYNDLEFYVLVRLRNGFRRRAAQNALDKLGHRLTPKAGVEVEFKCLSLDQLRNRAPSMFYYDLMHGHRWLVGSDDLLRGCEHHRNETFIGPSEAMRLLMNRCSGLLFAGELLRQSSFGDAERDFVGRNLAKAELALGDVVLAAQRQYHWSCVERHRRLKRLGATARLDFQEATERYHAAGVDFKLHPSPSSESITLLSARHTALCTLARKIWLWLESRRLKHEFVSIWAYAVDPVIKCPGVHPLKNALLHLRTFGPAGLFLRGTVRYPRERLLNSLALLLFESADCDQGLVLRRIQAALHTRAKTIPELISRYREIWSQFN